MRKNLFIISLLVLSASFIQAQEKGRVGFKAGVGFYRQNYKINGDQEHLDFKPGIVVGLFKEIPLSDNINFQPELMFIAMGSEDGGNKNKANYIALPMLFKIHGKRVGFVVGPQASLLVNAKMVDEFDGSEDVKDQYKSVDLGAIAGVELLFAKNNRGMAGVRYQAAINNVWKDSPAKSFIKNTGAQAYIGFRF